MKDDAGVLALVGAGETLGLDVCAGKLVCYGDECGDQSEMRVSDGSATAALASGESEALGSLTVVNGFLRSGQLRDCDEPQGPEYLMAAYRTGAASAGPDS